MPDKKLQTFKEFWPYYVREHSKPGTRALHFFGTTVGTLSLGFLIASGNWPWFPIAFVPGYAAAWIGHFFIEHNRPATFKYPLWSFISDYKMVGLMLMGKMGNEVQRAQSQK
jgi:hypothetical protein